MLYVSEILKLIQVILCVLCRMDIAVGAIYARKYFNNTVKKLVTEITERIKREMMKSLKDVDWMSEESR